MEVHDGSFLFPRASFGGMAVTPRPGSAGTGDSGLARPGLRPRMLEAWDNLEVGGFLCSMIDLMSSASRVSYFNNASASKEHVNPSIEILIKQTNLQAYEAHSCD